MRYPLSTLLGVVIIFMFVPCYAASLEKAEMMWQHGLDSEAKSEYIDVIFSNANDNTKAEALYKLGTLAFENKNVFAALNTWTQLVKKYPKSKQAAFVSDRTKELSEIVGELSKANVENAIAQSYLRHADFWSKEKDNIFKIDSSWIPNVEAAMKWYDKVIAEFPKTTASRVAYEGKMRAIIGWKETGRYGESHGIQSDFIRYMPELLKTFTAFETDHPDTSTLQAFRFQIAQEYWKHKDWENTRKWLTAVVEKSGSTDTFYKDLAQRRLQRVEY